MLHKHEQAIKFVPLILINRRPLNMNDLNSFNFKVKSSYLKKIFKNLKRFWKIKTFVNVTKGSTTFCHAAILQNIKYEKTFANAYKLFLLRLTWRFRSQCPNSGGVGFSTESASSVSTTRSQCVFRCSGPR